MLLSTQSWFLAWGVPRNIHAAVIPEPLPATRRAPDFPRQQALSQRLPPPPPWVPTPTNHEDFLLATTKFLLSPVQFMRPAEFYYHWLGWWGCRGKLRWRGSEGKKNQKSENVNTLQQPGYCSFKSSQAHTDKSNSKWSSLFFSLCIISKQFSSDFHQIYKVLITISSYLPQGGLYTYPICQEGGNFCCKLYEYTDCCLPSHSIPWIRLVFHPIFDRMQHTCSCEHKALICHHPQGG